MHQLIYASQYHNLSVLEVVREIVDKAKEYNLKNDLTGILAFSSGYFLQCLEGERSAVNKIYNKIVCDKRHFNVTLLSYIKVPERTFPFWTMAFASETDINRELYFKYGPREFNPFKMEPEGVMSFLMRLGIVYSEKLVPLNPDSDH